MACYLWMHDRQLYAGLATLSLAMMVLGPGLVGEAAPCQ
jgi:hypothetical protein